MTAWLFLLAAAALQPSVARTPPAAGEAQAPQSLAKARKLVELLNPPDLALRSNMKAWESSIMATLRLDPGAVKLEREYPGIMKAALEAGRPVGRELMVEFMRRSAEHKAALIAERLTTAEVDVALVQFAKPFWRRFLETMIANIDPSAAAREAAENRAKTGTPNLSMQALASTLRTAGRTTAGQMSNEDQIDMMRLSQLPFASKVQQISAENDVQTLEWVNNPEPSVIRRQSEAMQSAMIAFVDARKK